VLKFYVSFNSNDCKGPASSEWKNRYILALLINFIHQKFDSSHWKTQD